jgi:hypothetical protein
MTYHFIPAIQDTKPLTIAVSFAGGSGTGKTYSALRLARGIAGGRPFGVVDTENRRALHYRSEFPEMHHLDFSPFHNGKLVGYPPERWIDVIEAAEAAKLPVIVVDSFSNAWEGIGGVLETQDQVLERLCGGDASKRDKLGQLAWAEVKPRYRRLLERIIRAQCHIILCIRAKPVMQERRKGADGQWGNVNARPTKLRRADLPWDIAADRDLIFEMTVSFLMDPQHPGVPIVLKCADAFKPIFATGRMVDEAAGQAMAKWSTGDDDQRATKRLLDEAREAARKGTEAFRGWFAALDKASRPLVRTILDECQELATKADAAASDDDPFPGLATGPTTPEPDEPTRELVARIVSDFGDCETGDQCDGVKEMWTEQMEQIEGVWPEGGKQMRDAEAAARKRAGAV